MNPEQQKSILAIALFAAFADGAKHDREREEIRRIAESLGSEAGAPDLARLYQDVLLKRVTLEAALHRYIDRLGWATVSLVVIGAITYQWVGKA